MRELLPTGVLGIALTGLLAAFMAGMAANVSGFNTVFTYDIWRPYIVRDRDDTYYLLIGRIVTVIGIFIGIGTAFIAAQFNNIMNYIQTLFSYFNAPLFAVFILALFWRRASPWAGFWGQLAGIAAAFAFHYIGPHIDYFHAGQTASGMENAQMINFYGAIAAVILAWIVMAIVTPLTAAQTGERAPGAGLRPARPQRPRRRGREAGPRVVAVAQGAGLHGARHHPRPFIDLPVGGGEP